MTQVVPSIRPMPVTMPAPGASSSYRPFAASGLSSRNAEPGSSRRSMRSRTGSLPRSRWRSIERSSPPAPRSATAAWRARRSSTRAAMAVVVGLRLGAVRIQPAAQDGHGAMIGRASAGTGTGATPSGAPCRPPFVPARSWSSPSWSPVGCQALRAVARSRDRSGPLVTVTTRGGECFEGPCGSVTAIDRDGAVHQVEPAVAELGDGAGRDPDRARCARSRRPTSRPSGPSRSPGECPVNFDGQEVIYEFGGPDRRRAHRLVRDRDRPGSPAVRWPSTPRWPPSASIPAGG